MLLEPSNATAALVQASATAEKNPETSSLGSLEFNTPYVHEIAALAAVLVVVATASIALAVKFTRRPAPHHDEEGNGGGCVKSGWECAPIMHRLGGRYSYESLQQADCSRNYVMCGGGRGVFRFSARLDGANRLLCLYGMRLQLHSTGESRQALDGWQIAIDIVTQTDVECRQTRLQTRLLQAAAPAPDSAGGDFPGAGDGGWKSEPLEDVLAVRVNHDQLSAPLKGQLLIRVLGHRPSEWSSHHQQPHHQIPMVKLGGATFPLDRIRAPNVASLWVTLRDED